MEISSYKTKIMAFKEKTHKKQIRNQWKSHPTSQYVQVPWECNIIPGCSAQDTQVSQSSSR